MIIKAFKKLLKLIKRSEDKEETPVQVYVPEPACMKLPENYILLPSHTYGNYSYPDTLVAMEKSRLSQHWNEVQGHLGWEGAHMLTIRQFIDFLNLLRSGNAYDGRGRKVDSGKLNDIFKEITEVRDPWRAELLDADFKVDGENFIINYSHRFRSWKETLISKCSEPLAPCLMENNMPGIDLVEWLDNANYQGLPKEDVKSGALFYWQPGSDNISVARFSADSIGTFLDCNWNPHNRFSSLGTRSAWEKIKYF